MSHEGTSISARQAESATKEKGAPARERPSGGAAASGARHAGSRPTERRRQIEEAVRRATLELAEDTPFTDLTVGRIARAAGLSRTAFYFYFHDKRDVLMSATQEVADEMLTGAERWWRSEGEPEELVRAALQGAISLYMKHAALFRVVVEVSTYDPEVREFYLGLGELFVNVAEDFLRREQAAGRARAVDPRTTAEPLVWMSERFTHIALGVGDRPPESVVEALAAVWLRVMYPDRGVAGEARGTAGGAPGAAGAGLDSSA